MTQINTPPVRNRTSWADALERVIWTLVQAASATGLVAAYQGIAEHVGLPVLTRTQAAFAVVILTPVLSAIKNALAVKFGNGSAATLPDSLEPVPAGKVIAHETDSGLAVAGQAPLQGPDGEVPSGTPVQVAPAEPEDDPAGELPDEGGEPNIDVPIPADGFDDGTGHVLMPDGKVYGPDGEEIDPSKLS